MQTRRSNLSFAGFLILLLSLFLSFSQVPFSGSAKLQKVLSLSFLSTLTILFFGLSKSRKPTPKMRLSLAAVLCAPLAALAQEAPSTTAYTDPATGIAYQAYVDPGGFKFGVALPKNPDGDFIGLLVSFG